MRALLTFPSAAVSVSLGLCLLVSCKNETFVVGPGGIDAGMPRSPSVPNVPAPGSVPWQGLSDCDFNAAEEAACGRADVVLFSCPAGHAKPTGCTLSLHENSFCCAPPLECWGYCEACSDYQSDDYCRRHCLTELMFVSKNDGRCYAEGLAYVACVGKAANHQCDGYLNARSPDCEDLGTAAITCETDGGFARSKDNDALCVGQMHAYAYASPTAKAYSLSCLPANKDSDRAVGTIFCCH